MALLPLMVSVLSFVAAPTSLAAIITGVGQANIPAKDALRQMKRY